MRSSPQDILLKLMLQMSTVTGGFGAWERLQHVLDSLLEPGGLKAIAVYRWHQDNFLLLGKAGASALNLEFSERVKGRLQEGCMTTRAGLRLYPLLSPSLELMGCLALETLPRPRNAAFLRQLTLHLSHLLETSFGYSRGADQQRADTGMRRVLEKLVKSPRPVEVLRPLLLEMVAQLGANGAGLFAYRADSNTLQMVELVSYRRPQDEIQDWQFDSFTQVVPADITPYWERLLADQAPFLLDANNPDHHHYFWPGTREWHLREKEPLGVSFPLSLGDRPLGFIGLTFSEDRRPEIEALRLAEPFAQEAAITLGLIEMSENARRQLVHDQVKELEHANSTIQRGLEVIAGETDPRRALGKILKVACNYLGTDSGALWLYDEELRRFSVSLVLSGEELLTDSHRIAPGWPLHRDLYWRRHVEERRPIVYRIADLTPRSERAFFDRLGIKMLLGIPLFSGKRILGSITMRFTKVKPFSSSSLQLAQAVAHQATMALQLAELSSRAEELAVTAERNRMAGEIHDTVAQGLAASQAHLAAASGYLAKLDGKDAKSALHHLEIAERLTRSSLQETRHSLTCLQPMALAQASLSQALRQHLEQACEMFSCQCSWNSSGRERKLPEGIEGELFRIGQEAISNALRHSQAKTLEVNLDYRPKFIKLSIRDDGIGLVASQQRQGYGLRLMRERAERIGALLELSQPEGRGTHWQLRWGTGQPSLLGIQS